MLDKWSASAMVQTLVVTAVVAVGIKFIRWLLSCHAHFIFFNSLPGEREFSWIYGNLHKFRHMQTEERLRYLVDLTAKYPKFYRIWFGLRPLLDLHHPDSLRDLLKTAGPKPWIYDMFLPWLGEGLLISKGARWNRSRHLLTPAFHFDILKPYCNVNNRACDLLLEKVAKHAAEEKSIEMFGNISLCTFDIILQCAMSYTDDVQTRGESHPYVQAISRIAEMNIERSRNPLLFWDWVYALTSDGRKNRQLCDYVHGISDSVIKARQQTLEKEGPPNKRYLDFLDVLLTARDSNGVGLTPLEIRSEVDTFMFEGHDTTASSLAWTLYSLCEHPHYQKLVQQEIDTVLKDRQCDDITWDDLGKLEYLTLVIKEAMRLHCPVPAIGRLLTEPLTIEGVSLPAGTSCQINIYNLHHNPDLWPQPDVFDPDRFLPENTKNRDNYAFLPFSAGPRNCIGQHFSIDEQKVILGRLLRRFTFSLDPSHKVEKLEAGIMRTVNGMKMFAVPRTPTV